MAGVDERAHDYTEDELRYNRLMAPAYREAIASLRLPVGSRGLDAGCGPGGLLDLLDDATGRCGTTVGIDNSGPHVEAATKRIAELGLSRRVTAERADLRGSLPFPENDFDWAWCADVLYPSYFARPAAVVAELRRVVRPGGVVAVFFLNARGVVLPGHPVLEDRLNAATLLLWVAQDEPALLSMAAAEKQRWYANQAPDRHPEKALSWFRAVGLVEPKVSWHVVHGQYPLTPEARDYLGNYWFPVRSDRQRQGAGSLEPQARDFGVGAEEWRTWQEELANPDSPRYLLDQPDYHFCQVGMLTVGVRG